MNLGIVVVYLVREEDEALLELHLRQLDRHTEAPFQIFAAANRLAPRFRRRLQEHPRIRVCDVPDTPLRGYEEHAYYLDRLVPEAIEHGATHVALLNVDSFPIRSGWDRRLAERLSPSCVLAAVMRVENEDHKPHPSCIFFDRRFYLDARPTALLGEDEMSSAAFARYRSEHPVIADTGIGYGFRLHQRKLDWYPLLRSNRTAGHYIIGSVYGDLIFHLGGASRDAKLHIRERQRLDAIRDRSWISRSFSRLRKLGARLTPPGLRAKLRPYVLPAASRQILAESDRAYRRARERLLADPEAYFDELCSGSGSDAGGGRQHADG